MDVLRDTPLRTYIEQRRDLFLIRDVDFLVYTFDMTALLFPRSCFCRERPTIDEEACSGENTEAGWKRLARLDCTWNAAAG